MDDGLILVPQTSQELCDLRAAVDVQTWIGWQRAAMYYFPHRPDVLAVIDSIALVETDD